VSPRPARGVLLALAAAASACSREPKGGPPDAVAASSASVTPPAPARRRIARPPDAFAELGVLTDKPRAEIERWTAPSEVAKVLGPAHCGDACARVREVLADAKRTTLEVVSSGDWVLPPEDTLAFATPSLTDAERATVHRRPWVVAVRVRGAATPDHEVARTGFAATAAIAQQLGALVYDEEVRRIETAAQFTARAITAPLGAPAFRVDHVALQLYTQDDGSARLLTLGMRRFGAPDLELRGASMHAARRLAALVNALAARVAAGESDLPFPVAPQALGRAPGASADAGATARVDVIVPPHTAGDPDNEIASLVPEARGPDLRRSFDALAETLYGPLDRVVDEARDPRLAEIARRARAKLPQVLARWKRDEKLGTQLLVKLPFPYEAPEGTAARDAGPPLEWMWIRVTSFDESSVAGQLANAPAYATGLAMGSSVRGKRADVADWLVKLPDGGVEGGESVRVLEGRTP
jgi:hypothetical protein